MIRPMRTSHLGFTLIEVVVALAIAGFSLTALLHALGTSARQAELSREYSTATYLAESGLSRIGRDLPLEAGLQQGQFDQTYRWRSNITDAVSTQVSESRDARVKPFQIDFTVWWKSGDKVRDLTLRTLRLKANEM